MAVFEMVIINGVFVAGVSATAAMYTLAREWARNHPGQSATGVSQVLRPGQNNNLARIDNALNSIPAGVPTVIYIRLQNGLPVSPYSQSILASTGGVLPYESDTSTMYQQLLLISAILYRNPNVYWALDQNISPRLARFIRRALWMPPPHTPREVQLQNEVRPSGAVIPLTNSYQARNVFFAQLQPVLPPESGVPGMVDNAISYTTLSGGARTDMATRIISRYSQALDSTRPRPDDFRLIAWTINRMIWTIDRLAPEDMRESLIGYLVPFPRARRSAQLQLPAMQPPEGHVNNPFELSRLEQDLAAAGVQHLSNLQLSALVPRLQENLVSYDIPKLLHEVYLQFIADCRNPDTSDGVVSFRKRLIQAVNARVRDEYNRQYQRETQLFREVNRSMRLYLENKLYRRDPMDEETLVFVIQDPTLSTDGTNQHIDRLVVQHRTLNIDIRVYMVMHFFDLFHGLRSSRYSQYNEGFIRQGIGAYLYAQLDNNPMARMRYGDLSRITWIFQNLVLDIPRALQENVSQNGPRPALPAPEQQPPNNIRNHEEEEQERMQAEQEEMERQNLMREIQNIRLGDGPQKKPVPGPGALGPDDIIKAVARTSMQEPMQQRIDNEELEPIHPPNQNGNMTTGELVDLVMAGYTPSGPPIHFAGNGEIDDNPLPWYRQVWRWFSNQWGRIRQDENDNLNHVYQPIPENLEDDALNAQGEPIDEDSDGEQSIQDHISENSDDINGDLASYRDVPIRDQIIRGDPNGSDLRGCFWMMMALGAGAITTGALWGMYVLGAKVPTPSIWITAIGYSEPTVTTMDVANGIGPGIELALMLPDQPTTTANPKRAYGLHWMWADRPTQEQMRNHLPEPLNPTETVSDVIFYTMTLHGKSWHYNINDTSKARNALTVDADITWTHANLPNIIPEKCNFAQRYDVPVQWALSTDPFRALAYIGSSTPYGHTLYTQFSAEMTAKITTSEKRTMDVTIPAPDTQRIHWYPVSSATYTNPGQIFAQMDQMNMLVTFVWKPSTAWFADKTTTTTDHAVPPDLYIQYSMGPLPPRLLVVKVGGLVPHDPTVPETLMKSFATVPVTMDDAIRHASIDNPDIPIHGFWMYGGLLEPFSCAISSIQYEIDHVDAWTWIPDLDTAQYTPVKLSTVDILPANAQIRFEIYVRYTFQLYRLVRAIDKHFDPDKKKYVSRNVYRYTMMPDAEPEEIQDGNIRKIVQTMVASDIMDPPTRKLRRMQETGVGTVVTTHNVSFQMEHPTRPDIVNSREVVLPMNIAHQGVNWTVDIRTGQIGPRYDYYWWIVVDQRGCLDVINEINIVYLKPVTGTTDQFERMVLGTVKHDPDMPDRYSILVKNPSGLERYNVNARIVIEGGCIAQKIDTSTHAWAQPDFPKGKIEVPLKSLHWPDLFRFTYELPFVPHVFLQYFHPRAKITVRYADQVYPAPTVIWESPEDIVPGVEYTVEFTQAMIDITRGVAANPAHPDVYYAAIEITSDLGQSSMNFYIEEINLQCSQFAGIPSILTASYYTETLPLDIPEFTIEMDISCNCDHTAGVLPIHYGVDVRGRHWWDWDDYVCAETVANLNTVYPGKPLRVSIPVKIPPKWEMIFTPSGEVQQTCISIWAFIPSSVSAGTYDKSYDRNASYLAYADYLVWIPVENKLAPHDIAEVDEATLTAGARYTAIYKTLAEAGHRPVSWITPEMLAKYIPSAKPAPYVIQQIDAIFYAMYWDREISYLPVANWLNEIQLKWVDVLDHAGPKFALMIDREKIGRVTSSTTYQPETTQSVATTNSDYPQSTLKNLDDNLASTASSSVTTSSGHTLTTSEERDVARQIHVYSTIRTDLIREMCEEFGRFFI